jgi:flagellar hook-associated protein 1
MALNSILNTAVSGLYTAQSGMRAVSNNISNVNTPGYVRVDATQTNSVLGGRSAGVEPAALRRAADRFLQAAALSANAGLGQADASARHLDRVQAAFGDPTSDASLFSAMNRAVAAFETAVIDPGSTAARREALAYLDSFLSQLSQVGTEVASVREAAHEQLKSDVATVNDLLRQVVSLNGEIARGQISGDATGSEQRMSGVIDQLSGYMDIRVQQRADGTYEVRTNSGTALAGYTAAEITIETGAGFAPSYGRLMVAMGDGSPKEFEPSLQSGSLKGLIILRDQQLGGIAQSLGAFAGQFAEAVNAVHSLSATIPPIATHAGRDSGLLAGDALNFTGQTGIAVVNGDGTLARRIDIDFTAGTVSVDGAVAGATGGTVGSLTTAINAALGGLGSAGFVDGRLTISATGAGQGIAFSEPATGGSSRGGRSFTNTFGLNELITSGRPTSYATGLSATDAHGFVPGSTFSMRIAGANGELLAGRTMTVPAGTTITDLMAVMNDNVTGFGLYGGFNLSADGTLAWSPDPAYATGTMEMVSDTGPRGTTQQSLGQLFGLSQLAREQRASGLTLNATIKADPRKLGFAQPQMTGAVVGNLVVGMTDSRGAQALGAVVNKRFDFAPVPGGPVTSMRLADYMSTLGGDVATQAAAAETTRANAGALKDEATTRRSNVEGVNLDEELIKLTSYQQAYAASARMMTAVEEMFDALLRAV